MMAHAHPTFALRPFLPADAPLLAEIFRASIEELTGDDYSEAQQQAWSAAADDEAAFAARLADELTLIARQGVGTMLLDAIERLMAGRGAALLTADVSDSARDFFATRGYQPQRRNTVSRGGEWLANTTMEKPLPAKRAAEGGKG